MIKKEWFIKHKYIFYVLLFFILSYIVFGLNMYHKNIWFDEAYQMILNNHSIKDIIYYVQKDTSPPLYALLLKTVTSIFGKELFIARTLSLILFSIQFILAFYPMRRLTNEKVSIIYSILIMLSFYSFFCSIEIRLYSLSMTSAVGALLYGMLYLKEEKKSDLIKYILFSIVATYSHNYTTIYILFLHIYIMIYCLINKKNKKIILGNIITFICFIPWLNTLINQEQSINGNFWISKPNKIMLLDCLHKLINNNTTICIIIFLLLIISIILIKDKKKSYRELVMIVIPHFLCVLSFIIFSLVRNPLFIPKYLTPVCGVFYLGIAYILGKNKTIIIPFIIIILLIPNFITMFQTERALANDQSTKRMIKFINSYNHNINFFNISESDFGITEYYFPNRKHYLRNDIYLIIREKSLFGKVEDNYSEIKDDKLILLSTEREPIDLTKYDELKDYILIDAIKNYCAYNGGYEVLILEKKT